MRKFGCYPIQIKHKPIGLGINWSGKRGTHWDYKMGKWWGTGSQTELRVIWIAYGDSNTKYFYAQLKIRSSRNSIQFVYNEGGIKLTEAKEVEQEFISVFKKIMGLSSGFMLCPDTVVL